jgi:hypothetical protein
MRRWWLKLAVLWVVVLVAAIAFACVVWTAATRPPLTTKEAEGGR